MTHLVVVGTSHTLQCGHESVAPNAIRAYEVELRSLIDKYSIKRISEEMSADGLVYHSVSETVAERIARDRCLAYQQVDLPEAERALIGLHDGPVFTVQELYRPDDSGQSFRTALSVLQDEVRERVWAHRILSQTPTPVLFVCGALHVAAIQRIWSLFGMRCDVEHHCYAA